MEPIGHVLTAPDSAAPIARVVDPATRILAPDTGQALGQALRGADLRRRRADGRVTAASDPFWYQMQVAANTALAPPAAGPEQRQLHGDLAQAAPFPDAFGPCLPKA